MNRKQVPFTFGPDRSIPRQCASAAQINAGRAQAVRSEVHSSSQPGRGFAVRLRAALSIGAARLGTLFATGLVWFGREFCDACERIGSSSWFVVIGVAVALSILFASAQGWLL